MIGRTLAHYEIKSMIGKGGMGEVFRAKDRKLGRNVAIKVLPVHLEKKSRSIARFHREAKLLAQLEHPNIAAIHSLEECGGTHFLVLELVEGVTLADRLRSGKIPIEQALRLALQVAEALKFAHEKGIIHRDLKPSNIKITTSGSVKVLDFGLAKALANGPFVGDGSNRTTQVYSTSETGVVLGTAAYMSPEQAKGLELDRSSDVWAFGVVLFEMFTAKPLFLGKTIGDTLYNVLNADIDWGSLPSGIAEETLEMLRLSLTRERKDRLQNIEDACAALRKSLADPEEAYPKKISFLVSRKRTRGKLVFPSLLSILIPVLVLLAVGFYFWWDRTADSPKTEWKTTSKISRKDSIAVLPFVNISSDPEQEYFCDGLTEEMIARLSQLGALKVTARTSAFAFKGQHKDIREVGRKLGVDRILEGSVRRDGNRLRINAQLINVSDGFHLWTEVYEREFEKIFQIQDDIAVSVARALKVAISEQQRHPEQTEDLDAYNEFLLGKHYYSNPTKNNLKQSISHYRRAVDLDPEYANAWAAMAAAQASQASFGYVPISEGYPDSLVSVYRALALDEETASAHAVLGWIQMTYEWDWARANSSFARALELEPGNGLPGAAQLSLALGRMEQALQLARQTVEIDALNDSANMTMALTAYYADRYEEASLYLRKALELSPDRANAHALLAEVLLCQSRLPEALAEVEKEKDNYWRMPELCLVHYALGRKKESDAYLSEFMRDYQDVGAFQIAQIYAFRNEEDKAFEWLEKAYAQRDGGLFLTKGNPFLRKLNHDPRFAAFLKKMNLPID